MVMKKDSETMLKSLFIGLPISIMEASQAICILSLSTSRFHPGPIAKGPEPRSSEEMMYEDLVLKYAPGTEEAVEIQKKHNSLNENISLTPKNRTLIEKWIKEHGTRQADLQNGKFYNQTKIDDWTGRFT